MSDYWLIDLDNVEVVCDPDTHILTTSRVSNFIGATVAFLGSGVLSPNNVPAPQRNEPYRV
jgi:hypothetical protein